ncbi:hypothetical protein ASPZODRAFT_59752 [Penicilliopsis zonata CBS 506.65]|uniref:Thioesterase domain-containing protein n=1 Tax=Penicilliopsis zonata CBS 506.65 TaxID=1073090 RepID=A0A1L9SQA6_9EURO|nr:hypothetical protein ASPZODRAFT_59752 [Penicilliopsis zonata CBS 506.65]OJJ49316.1 hypothetical protein ASPZODRAFT_59752 [Penicilliopsis zonata CBS 506.65]
MASLGLSQTALRLSVQTLKTTTRSASQAVSPPSPSPNPLWLTTIKRRIGRCLMFGLNPPQIHAAGSLLAILARDWRGFLVGSEGFLVDTAVSQDVTWGEMLSHVNNVTYVRYAESARVNLMRRIAHLDPDHASEWRQLVGSTAVGLILRSIKVDYKFPMTYPDRITVYHKLAQPCETAQPAFEFQVVILSEARQRPAARCQEDIVTYDYRLGRKTAALPPFMLSQFRAMWDAQLAAREEWCTRTAEIERLVRGLEVDSWDRPDAVEDMGTA